MDINICKKCREYRISPPAFCGLTYYNQEKAVSVIKDKKEYGEHLDKANFEHPQFQIPHDCKYKLEHLIS